MSLDGYIADRNGQFDWAEPTRTVHEYINELERPFGTYLYGRRMYEVMAYWELDELTSDDDSVISEYARIWRGADKIVFSRSLRHVDSARTSLQSRFDPSDISALKATSDRPVSIGGATLASVAFAAGLVDRFSAIVVPVTVGSGTAALPRDQRHDFVLLSDRRIDEGVVHLDYRVTT